VTESVDTKGNQYEELRQEHEALLSRLRHLEQTFVRDLGAVKEYVHLQIETTEKRIFTRVLEELDKRIQKTVGAAAGKIVGLEAKPYGGKLSLDLSNDSAAQGVGTPFNEEPEQEYDTCDISECSSIQASGSRRESEIWKSPSVDESPPHKASQKEKNAAEVSSAELADNRRRLQAIGNAARSITGSLGGNAAREPVSHTPQTKLAYDGLQTPDFAGSSFAESPLQMATSAPDNRESSDGLDAEMARLADLRRFASSVLKAAESQCPGSGTSAPSSWNDAPHSGRMSGGAFGTGNRQSCLRNAANHQDRQDPPFDSSPPSLAPDGGTGRRRTSSAPVLGPPPWEDTHRRSLTPRGLELPAQPPPQPPPTQVDTQSGQWPSAMPRRSTAQRRSAAQPLHVPWPAAGGSSDWQGGVQNEGRLVF